MKKIREKMADFANQDNQKTSEFQNYIKLKRKSFERGKRNT